MRTFLKYVQHNGLKATKDKYSNNSHYVKYRERKLTDCLEDLRPHKAFEENNKAISHKQILVCSLWDASSQNQVLHLIVTSSEVLA